MQEQQGPPWQLATSLSGGVAAATSKRGTTGRRFGLWLWNVDDRRQLEAFPLATGALPTAGLPLLAALHK